MALGNWTVSTYVPEVDETRLAGEAPADYVLRLAEAKARAAQKDSPPEDLIVAADTAVVDGETVLGKPAHAAEAAKMLRQLRGRTHQVYTGLAVLRADFRQALTDVCVTDVPMRRYGDLEIEAYVASADPLDKAGAYGIQHAGFHPVQDLAGCYASVMGLPLCHLLRLLRQFGAAAQSDLPRLCQIYLDYACPVSDAVLRGEVAG